MTDQTPEDRDHELELREQRDRLLEHAEAHERDLAAILMVRPKYRTTLLKALAESGGLADVTEHMLRWIDEMFLCPELDELRLQLLLQSEVALAITPDGLADIE